MALLGCVVDFHSSPLRTLQSVATVAVLIPVLTNSVQGSPFLLALASAYLPSTWSEVIPPCLCS